jgi:hypothetical protein
MADVVKMVVIDGVRYREEDAPQIEAKQVQPKNKSRSSASKADSASEK